MNTKTVEISSLRPDDANARRHSERNLSAIMESLRRFGQQKPIVVSSDGVVVAGNGTLEAARRLGWESISVSYSSLSGDELRAFAIADNRTAELAEWDDAILRAQLESLAATDLELLKATGFDGIDDASRMVEIGEAPEEFKEIDESIETNCQCPKCGYRWTNSK